jgi:CheY-like chemotaxis protein
VTERTPKILVVDDVPENVRLLEAVLVPRGYEVVTADDGDAALDLVEAEDPDLILLDVMMPGRSGRSAAMTSTSASGIALGYATCGEVGFEGRSDYAAIGAVTNLAARLADEATGGQVLIAQQRLYAEIEQDIEVEPAGEFALNGFRRPVAAFDVAAVRSPTAEPSRP